MTFCSVSWLVILMESDEIFWRGEAWYGLSQAYEILNEIL